MSVSDIIAATEIYI